MRRYIAWMATILAPVLAGLHAALYEVSKNALSSLLGVSPVFGGLIASMGISGIGIAAISLCGWVIWRVLHGRVRRKVRQFYWDSVVDMMSFLRWFQDETNREIGLYLRCTEENIPYDYEKWENLKRIYTERIAGCTLLIVDITIERCLLDNVELSVVNELREPITLGLKRIENMLLSGEKGINTIYRVEEMLVDVNHRHLAQFQRCLSRM